MFLRVLSILHGVSLFRGARDSWETLSVVAKEKYKSTLLPRHSNDAKNAPVAIDVCRPRSN